MNHPSNDPQAAVPISIRNDRCAPMLIVLLVMTFQVSAAMADTTLAFTHLDARMDHYERNPTSPRLIESYAITDGNPPCQRLVDIAFVYDNALVLLAYLHHQAPGSRRRARVLADAFVYAMNHDRYYHDGRLRNAYSAKQLISPKTGKADLPGWWETGTNRWREDGFQVGSHTGNMAWVVIALSQYYRKYGGEQYKQAAIRLGTWIDSHTNDDGRGYRGGFEGWEPNPEVISWKSTEHNIDIYVAFSWLYRISADDTWKVRAAFAKGFVASMWSKDHFLIGTQVNGTHPETGNPPLDIQAWSILAFGDDRNALEWTERICHVKQSDGAEGFDFNTNKDGIWYEGTAHMVLAYRAVHACDKAALYLDTLRKTQLFAPGGNGKGIVAASWGTRVDTGLGWNYFPCLHIGATAWYIFAETGINPYLGTSLPCSPKLY